MGVLGLQSYYRWNAVCGESRTCGVDLDEIPRRIVRDDETEPLEGEWRYFFEGDHERTTERSTYYNIDWEAAILYGKDVSDTGISKVAYYIGSYSPGYGTITPVVYGSNSNASTMVKIWEGDPREPSSGWVEVAIPEDGVSFSDAYDYYLFVVEINSPYIISIGIDSSGRVDNGGFIKVQSNSSWETINNNLLMKVYVEYEPRS